MNNVDYALLPTLETPEQKELRKINAQKHKIYSQFLKKHPNMTDAQEIRLFQARLNSASVSEFVSRLKNVI